MIYCSVTAREKRKSKHETNNSLLHCSPYGWYSSLPEVHVTLVLATYFYHHCKAEHAHVLNTLSCNAGAETGAGGRMRDTHATGIGSIMGAGTAGYCVGNLQLDGMPLPGEDPSFPYPESLASPLQVAGRACFSCHRALPLVFEQQ